MAQIAEDKTHVALIVFSEQVRLEFGLDRCDKTFVISLVKIY